MHTYIHTYTHIHTYIHTHTHTHTYIHTYTHVNNNTTATIKKKKKKNIVAGNKLDTVEIQHDRGNELTNGRSLTLKGNERALGSQLALKFNHSAQKIFSGVEVGRTCYLLLTPRTIPNDGLPLKLEAEIKGVPAYSESSVNFCLHVCN